MVEKLRTGDFDLYLLTPNEFVLFQAQMDVLNFGTSGNQKHGDETPPAILATSLNQKRQTERILKEAGLQLVTLNPYFDPSKKSLFFEK